MQVTEPEKIAKDYAEVIVEEAEPPSDSKEIPDQQKKATTAKQTAEPEKKNQPATTQNLTASQKPRTGMSPILSEFVKTWTLRLFSLALGVIGWHFLTLYNVDAYINFENVPSPATVGSVFIDHVQDTEFYIHIGVSMGRIIQGYLAATILGILLGLVMGRSKLANSLMMPYIEVFRPIPAVAWIPLAILMWPTEESSIIYITFLGALFPIILNTIHGVEQTPEVLVRAALSLGASRLQIFWHVVIPAAMPSISAGLAIGMGVSWFSLLAGEIISGQYGIGYFTWNAYSLINYPDIVVGMLVIGVLGTMSTYGVRLLTRPLLAWQQRSR